MNLLEFKNLNGIYRGNWVDMKSSEGEGQTYKEMHYGFLVGLSFFLKRSAYGTLSSVVS